MGTWGKPFKRECPGGLVETVICLYATPTWWKADPYGKAEELLESYSVMREVVLDRVWKDQEPS